MKRFSRLPMFSRREILAGSVLAGQVVLVAVMALAGFVGSALTSLGLLVATVGVLLLDGRRTSRLQAKRSQAQVREIASSLQAMGKSVQALRKALDANRSEIEKLGAEVRGVRISQRLMAQTSGATLETLQQTTRTFADHLAHLENSPGQPE